MRGGVGPIGHALPVRFGAGAQLNDRVRHRRLGSNDAAGAVGQQVRRCTDGHGNDRRAARHGFEDWEVKLSRREPNSQTSQAA